MATESTAPPSLTDQKSSNPGSDLVKPTEGGGHDAKEEAAKENLGKSVFVNSEPMREEQVQNAIKFLSHPRVRGSPVIYRRSFLEQKGLTKEEIDEAFRRVPDPPSNITSAQAAISSKDGQLPSSTNLQLQVSATAQQLPVASTSGGPTVAAIPRSRFHWSHAFLAAGLLAASGAGTAVFLKNAVVPRLKDWIRTVVLEEDDSEERDKLKPSPAEEAVAAAKAAAVAAADVAKASQEMLITKNEEKKYFESFMNLLDLQVEEMKSMSKTLRKLESATEVDRSSDQQIQEQVQYALGNGRHNNTWRNMPHADHVDPRLSHMVSKQAKADNVPDIDLGSVRPSSLPASVEPTVAPHSKSYMEIVAMIQRGEKPPGIKDIDDRPPNPNQPPSNPHLVPRSKPWEADRGYGTQSQVISEAALNYDVHQNGSSMSNGKSSGSAGDSSDPWWRRKTVKITEVNRATDDADMDRHPVQHAWLPPKPPTVAMPEAAAAIRQQKPLVQKEQSSDYENEIRKPATVNDDPGHVAEISNGFSEGNSGDGEEKHEGDSEEVKY